MAEQRRTIKTPCCNEMSHKVIKKEVVDEYQHTIMEAIRKFPPAQAGGCFQATRFICSKHKELTEKTVSIRKKDGVITHCIAVMPDGRIIDTQHFQFGLIIDLDSKFENRYIFTQEEHEKYLPRGDTNEKI